MTRGPAPTSPTYQFAAPACGPTFINDVIIAGGAAWFTNSLQPNLYRVPIGHHGSVGPASTWSSADRPPT